MKYAAKLPREEINVSPTHPLLEAALLVGGVTLGATALAVAVVFIVDLAVLLVPPQTEVAFFSKTIARTGWLTADESDEARRLQRLTDRLAAHWKANPYAIRVGIDSSSEINAFALPGGVVRVTRGLLDAAESENEMAFVLAHELGHFENRDHLRGLGRGVAVALLMTTLGSTGAGGSVPELVELVGESTMRGFDREQERAADRFGLLLLHAEYGHVTGMKTFFERLAERREGDAPGVAGFLSTHPGPDNRIADLEAFAHRRAWPTEGEVMPLAIPGSAL